MKVVEFFGLSGVGKTSLSTRTRSLLDENNVCYVPIGAKVPYTSELWPNACRLTLAGCLWKDPLTAVRLVGPLVYLAIVSGSSGIRLRDRLGTALIWWRRLVIYVRFIHTERQSNNFYILERGMAGNLLSILVRMESTNIKPLYDALRKSGAAPDCVIVVEAPRAKIANRRQKRGNPDKSWMKDASEEERRFGILLDLLSDGSAKPQPQIVRIDASEDENIERNAEYLVETFTQGLSVGRG